MGPLILVKIAPEKLKKDRQYLVSIRWPGDDYDKLYLGWAYYHSKKHPVEWQRGYWFIECPHFSFQVGVSFGQPEVREIYLVRRFG